uniref:PLAT domain-containing protein n=1 Tax=Junco hyemalis TaxID=40217 RepID=A0A8C5IXN4_JUNHY
RPVPSGRDGRAPPPPPPHAAARLLPPGLGDISSFKIRLNNDGKSSTWFLSRAEVEDMSTRKVWFFLCRKWLSLDKNHPSRALKFSVTDPQTPLPKADYFLIHFNRRLTEYHLWISVFAPVNAGAFTRFQRLCTFLAVLLFTMLVNIMFFNAEKDDEAPIYLRYVRSMAVGIECALLTLPVEMLIIVLFKYSQKDPPPAGGVRGRTAPPAGRPAPPVRERGKGTGNRNREPSTGAGTGKRAT